ncbi:MAG: mannitol dehydrogenase family protein [Succinivibrio sp.]|nr:mannitol dehydrogenase family protein [Succinivibrio sp.]
MKVTLDGISKDKAAFEQAGVVLPRYDVKKMQEHTVSHPVWLHMGAGNIFRGFIASLQEQLLNEGLQQSGILTLTPISAESRDLILDPHDNLTMSVTLLPDTSVELQVIGSVVHEYVVNGSDEADLKAVRQMFCDPKLQMLSFTITEKGYALTDIEGNRLKSVEHDLKEGPGKCQHAMSVVAAMLFERFKAGRYPLAVVSMDNCARNGDKLRDSVLTIAKGWLDNGFVERDFIDYLNDGSCVSFPCTMIDKITPRPDPVICKKLGDMGIEDMDPVKTKFGTFLAPFVNAEKPQYLVVEDDFPNGRPPLEKAGVLFTDKRGVDLCERMKVTTCLNPLHTAMAVYGCVLGYERISAEMEDKQIVALVKKLGFDEGLKVVEDPKILNPRDFITEVVEQRLTNKCLPDTPQRIATDTSLKVPVRFGETLKNYQKQGLDASTLVALPLAIAGWLRYLMAVDDNGKPIELSDDPQKADLQGYLGKIKFGEPESVKDNLHPILSNAALFGVNLYDVSLGLLVETMFAKEIAGPGAVRKTLIEYLG